MHPSGVLGASPDGIVSENEIVEVKCPFKFRAKSIEECIKEPDCFIKKTIIDYIVHYINNFFLLCFWSCSFF